MDNQVFYGNRSRRKSKISKILFSENFLDKVMFLTIKRTVKIIFGNVGCLSRLAGLLFFSSVFTGMSQPFYAINPSRDPNLSAYGSLVQWMQLPVRDPYRILHGKTNVVSVVAGWVQVWGNIIDHDTNGILINGIYGSPEKLARCDIGAFYQPILPPNLARKLPRYPFATIDVIPNRCNFYVVGVPKDCDDTHITLEHRIFVYPDGFYTFFSPHNQQKVQKLSYGEAWLPPVPTQEQIVAKKTEAKKKADELALKANQTAAEKGDAYGLLRMGERYRDGDGVEKDPAKARNYLQKAAASGSSTAKEELEKLP